MIDGAKPAEASFCVTHPSMYGSSANTVWERKLYCFEGSKRDPKFYR